MDSRKSKILKNINVKVLKGLELGPLHRPTVTKDEGQIYYLDHASRDDLIRKYKGHEFGIEDIVEVDIVLKGGLKESVGNDKFDYIIASHVIEHIPDMVTWLSDIASILNKKGVLSLVIPDKRYCFDVARNTSSPSDVIGAFYDKITKPSSTMMYDAWAEFRDVDPGDLWASNESSAIPEPSTERIDDGWIKAKDNLKGIAYIDAHCYTFTPKSFFRILDRLAYHNLLDFEVIGFSDTAPNEQEFFVTLRKSAKRRKLAVLEEFHFHETNPLENELIDLRLKLNSANKQLSDIAKSTSWRITKPLRALSTLRRGLSR